MERLGRATWQKGWDHDLGGVFNGRAQREAAEIQILRGLDDAFAADNAAPAALLPAFLAS